MELYNAKFLDMFSGTGQVGIEAISNGATSTFIDLNTALLKKNIEQIGCQDFSRVFSGDFKRVMSDLNVKGEKFDFIFADPPYNDGLYSDIIRFSMPLLSEDGKIILEHSSDCEITAPDDAIIFDKRAYGSRSLTFLGGKNEKNGVSGEL
jgi:16S rRNA (guanine966-N2)-methyltransferase